MQLARQQYNSVSNLILHSFLLIQIRLNALRENRRRESILRNLEIDKELQKVKDEEMVKTWRRNFYLPRTIFAQTGEHQSKVQEPPLGLGKTLFFNIVYDPFFFFVNLL